MRKKIALTNPKSYFVLFMDAILVFLSYWLAYALKFESFYPPFHVAEFFRQSVGPIIIIKLIVFYYYGLQAGMWRYTSVIDLLNILKATAVSSAIIMIGVLFYYYTNIAGTFSRTVFIIDAINTVIFIGMFRLSIRIYYNSDLGLRGLLSIMKPSGTKKGGGGGISILIYGANERGELLLRSLTGGVGPHHYDPIGFLDDDQKFWGGNIHGYPAFGGMDNFEDVITRFSVKELMIASQVTGDRLEKINTECRRLNVVCRVVPSHLDASHTRIDASLLRGIQIEDLLNREPVTIEYSKIESFLKGGRVLITGAGGSIGSQLATHIAQFGPSDLIFVEKSENYLYELGLKMKKFSSGSINFSYNCVDVTNEGQMDRLLAREKPQYVFHAAANKHVPLMEMNIETAITNNIGGIKVMADLSDKHGVERFILISTDKAVNPVNVMGATKKVCELYVQSMDEKSATSFMAVRFGNVLGSNGSVAPLFMRQIENRGPVTVTDKDVKRYFMTIPEAVLLILQAASMGGDGKLYLLDMGEQVKILDLAEKMIQMAGFEPYKDIKIEFCGLRPGEKIDEELTCDHETLETTDHPKINSVRSSRENWKGIGRLVDNSLDLCGKDQDAAYRNILSWINSPTAHGGIREVTGPETKIVGL